MLKLMGSLVILGGVWGLLYEWWRGKKTVLMFIDQYIDFLIAGSRAVLKEKRRLVDFLGGECSRNTSINECTYLVADAMRGHTLPRGEDIWEQAWKSQLSREIPQEVRQLVYDSGRAFFAKNTIDSMKWFEIYEERFRDLYERERCSCNEQKKVVFPVGTLSGVILVVLLI